MPRPKLEVADIFRANGAAYRQDQAGHLNLPRLKVMSAIEGCRTAALMRACIGLHQVRPPAHRLQLVSQSALPEVPGWGRMQGRAALTRYTEARCVFAGQGAWWCICGIVIFCIGPGAGVIALRKGVVGRKTALSL